MTEKFRLAANVLLKRRLNKLVRIDDKVEIDRDYITCAEYQLFIDDMRQEGQNRQPDHWISERFPTGEAKNPVTGIRASDAKEFCQWLSQKESVSGFRYRLPGLVETKELLANTGDLGYWCQDDNNLVISGITNQQCQSWQEQLSKYLVIRNPFDLNLDLNLDLYQDLYRDLYQDLNLNLKLELNRYLDFERYRDLYRDLYQDLNINRFLNRFLNRDLDFDLNRNLNINRVLNRDLDFDLNRVLNLYQVLKRDLNPYRALNFYLDLDRVLNRDLYFELSQKIETNRASNLLLIYFPLIFVIICYQLLVIIYIQLGKAESSISLIYQKYRQKGDQIYQLYTYLVLIDQRQKGNMPAWEGIRIVREREEID